MQHIAKHSSPPNAENMLLLADVQPTRNYTKQTGVNPLSAAIRMY